MRKKILTLFSVAIVLASMLVACTTSKNNTDAQSTTSVGTTDGYIEGVPYFGDEDDNNSDSTSSINEEEDFDATLGNMDPNDASSGDSEIPSNDIPTTIKEYVVVNNGTTAVVTTSVYVTTTKHTTTKKGTTTTTTENPNDLEPDFN